MRAPMSWLSEYVDLSGVTAQQAAALLTAAGLKVEHIDVTGADIENVVIARVDEIEDLTGFKKPIRWVTLFDGTEQRQVICGATNFAVGDVVAYARPPAMLPGGFRIERRPAYGRESDGMICSARELGLGDDHTGILVLGRADDEVHTLGADAVDALGLRDTVLDVAVNPDRGYALSIRGIARELATALGVEFTDPAARKVEVDGTGYAVRIDDTDGCDRYVARTVTGLDAAATSPAWLQRRLTLAGMRPISLTVDVTNHVMLELGQPMHAFDATTLRGGIVVRRAAPGERLKTLDDVERDLHQDDLVIADDSGPIAIAGVMGGASTEISESTAEIVLESAHFDPVSVARTGRRHRLSSEAARRFERGVDNELGPIAADLAVEMLVELGGATAAPGVTDVDERAAGAVITLDPALPGRLAGLDYPAARVRARLEDVGCTVDGTDVFDVTPPSWRPDLQLPVDLVEEVVRLEGYDDLPSTVPAAPAGRGLTRTQRQRRQVSRALAEAGFAEVLSYPFVSAATSDQLMLASDDPRRSTVRLANPVSDEEPWLRGTLLPGLLAALGRNVSRGFTDVGLFEVGPVFRRAAGDAAMPHPPAGVRPTADVLAAMEAALPQQPAQVAVVMAGAWERDGWWGAGRPVGWADAIAAARTVAASVGADLEVRAASIAPWHPGRCAELRVLGEPIGWAGELHPRVVEAFGLPPRACAMELALQPVLDAAPELAPGPLVSAYPAASLDVALVVPADVPAAAVTAALRDGAGPLLEDLRLFDVFAGDQVGAGHKSLAFRLHFRAGDRTLTVEEAVAHRDAAVAVAHERCGATLRA